MTSVPVSIDRKHACSTYRLRFREEGNVRLIQRRHITDGSDIDHHAENFIGA